MLLPVRLAYEILDRRARRRLPLVIGSFALVAALDALSIGLVFPLMLALVDPEALGQLVWLQEPLSWLGAEDHSSAVRVLGLIIGGLFVVKSLLTAALVRWQFVIVSEAEAHVGVRLLGRYLTCEWPLVSGRNSSELIRNASYSTSHTFLSVVVPGLVLFAESLLALAVLVILIAIDPSVALMAFALLLGGALSYFAVARRRLAWVGERFQSAQFGLLNHLKQGLLAGREVRVLGRQTEFLRQLSEVRTVYADAQAKRLFLYQLPRYYFELLLILAVLTVFGLALTSRTTSEILPTMAVFGVSALRLMSSANRILAAVQQIRVGLPSLKAVHADLCNGQLASDKVDAATLASLSSDGSGLRLDRVTFSYADDRPAVSDVSLDIAWGSSLGIVGPSGSGKSTLIDLILGLLIPQSGSIRIDGQDQQAIMAEWRGRVGYVPQHIYLTDDSLRRNIAFGLNDAEIEEGKLLAAVRMAHLESTVETLSEGLETKVGEQGATLSGGQRQRVGIARALYHDPDVLILDEATSALDNETERTVIEAVESLSGRKTVIVVAHRLTTVRRCDRIALLADGRISALGGFAELARNNPDFARLVELGRLPEEGPATADGIRRSRSGGA